MASKGQKNGSESKKTGTKPASAPKGPAAKKPAPETASAEPAIITTGSSKPDQAAYNKEQDALKVQIDAAQAKLVCFFFGPPGDLEVNGTTMGSNILFGNLRMLSVSRSTPQTRMALARIEGENYMPNWMRFELLKAMSKLIGRGFSTKRKLYRSL